MDQNTQFIKGLNHITLAVQDIDISFTFYRDILGLKPLCKWDKGAYFLAGETWFCLNLDPSRIANPCYTHYAFHVEEKDFNRLEEIIRNYGCPIFKENTSPGKSFYFIDPDGHKLEIHSDTWIDRITHKKDTPGTWKNIEWFV